MLLNKYRSFLNLWKAPIFLGAAGLLLFFNLFCLSKETIKMTQTRKRAPYTFLGDRFRGLEKIVGEAPYLGYYTDKNIDDNRSAMQFAQAQLVLAPAILDLNNTGHEFIIFDCTSPAIAIKKIRELGLKPLKANSYGIILTRNPNTTTFHPNAAKETFNKTIQKQRP